MPKFNILCLDGGGLRGYLTILFLKELEKISNNKIYELFDLIVGTSTGGILACGIAYRKPQDTIHSPNAIPLTKEAKFTLDELKKFYLEDGQKIFPYPPSKFNRYLSQIKSLFTHEYSNNALTEALSKRFGDSKLTENNLLTHVGLVTYNSTFNLPHTFYSLDYSVTPENISSAPKIVDVCLATSAAPTVLPAHTFMAAQSHKYVIESTFIDGGIYHNNPTFSALSWALPKLSSFVENSKNLDCNILSVGTGEYNPDVTKTAKRGGKLGWAKNALNLTMFATSQSSHEASSIILNKLKDPNFKGNYLRLNVELNRDIDFTDSRPETLHYMEESFYSKFINNNSKREELIDFSKKL